MCNNDFIANLKEDKMRQQGEPENKYMDKQKKVNTAIFFIVVLFFSESWKMALTALEKYI